MNPGKLLVLCISFTSLLNYTGCSPKTVVKQDTQETIVPSSPVSISSGDTVRYSINFKDDNERNLFISKFHEFIDDYSFAKTSSTDHSSVVINALPVKSSENRIFQESQVNAGMSQGVKTNLLQTISDTSSIRDTVYTVNSGSVDLLKPVAGGSVKIYTQRSIPEVPFSYLVSAYPFDRNGAAGLLTIADRVPKRLVLRMNGRLTNAKGRVLSALDIIDSWTKYVKTNPAEGLALFRYVEGMREYIDGREAVIRGFLATDQNTIQLKMSQDDPDIVDRISTSRLLGSNVRSGSYYIDTPSAEESVFLLNKTGTVMNGYLDKITIRHGGDVNPVLSFSLKKYDAIMLTTSADISYAKQNLAKSGSCDVLANERYFIAVNCKEPTARRYIGSLVNAQDILKNFVKADGECISALEEYKAGAMSQITDAKHPGMIQPVKVLFRKDDTVSKIIAEKLVAEFTKGNIPCLLAAAGVQEYEKLLVSRNYGCAVGWVSDKITDDKSEKLRLATMWFSDQKDEQARIANFQEIPLFEIKRYILYRNGLVIPDRNLQNMYVQSSSN